MKNLVPAIPVVLDFAPVPREYRYDGWTPERQRAFLAALAQTGSVRAAAKRINMSAEGAYCLRAAPGAESFRAAWESALAHGIQNLTDIAIDRATEGVPVPVFWRGEQMGEKRWFNDRLLTFILRHHLPDRYGAALNGGTRSRATVERAAAQAKAAAGQPGEEARRAAVGRELLGLYAIKVEAERRHRAAGEVITADFTLRQLTHLEVMLDGAGLGDELIDRWTTRPGDWGGTVPVHVSGISKFLSQTRSVLGAPRRAGPAGVAGRPGAVRRGRADGRPHPRRPRNRAARRAGPHRRRAGEMGSGGDGGGVGGVAGRTGAAITGR